MKNTEGHDDEDYDLSLHEKGTVFFNTFFPMFYYQLNTVFIQRE